MKEIDLKNLVKHICESIKNREFRYSPAKYRNMADPRPANGWPQRLLTYRWRDSSHAFGDDHLLSDAVSELRVFGEIILTKKALPENHHEKFNQVVTNLFEWGGVLRGHIPINTQAATNVVYAALTLTTSSNTPMDSAWTKLAAFASAAFEDRAEVLQQAIFDSRVSVALLRHIEHAMADQPDLVKTKELLISCGLGLIPGRGGTRPVEIEKLKVQGWKSAYRSWNAHFLAAKIICHMRDHLNSVDTYGAMPTKNGDLQAWNVRGVEKVLFMDGY